MRGCIAPVLLLCAQTAPCLAQLPPAARFRGGAGQITLEIAADARYTFSMTSGPIVLGALTGAGDGSITFRDDGGRLACRDSAGVYRWSDAGDTLRFTVVADSCQGRRNVLVGGPWLRVRDALVLRGATVIDGTGAPPRPGMTLVIRDGLIQAVHPDGTAPDPAGAEVRDLGGAFVLPGFIDAHVHLATNPSTTDRRDRVEERLRMTLAGGVTSVRDMAGDGRALADLARAAGVGDIVAPDIRYAAVIAGPSFFDDPRVVASSAGVRPGSAPWARAVSDTTDLRQVIAEARGTGASAVKLYGALDGRLARRVADEAHRQGLMVWAHAALIPARPSDVVAAGADVVSHAHLLALESLAAMPSLDERNRFAYAAGVASHPAVQRLLATMAARRVILEPTLFVFRGGPALPDTASGYRMATAAFELARAAHAAGVRIAAGTDGMIGQQPGSAPNLHEELELLVSRAGLTPMEAIVAATATNAEVLGIQRTHGTIAPGKVADLLVLSADPTRDIRNTRQVRLVLKRGKPVTP